MLSLIVLAELSACHQLPSTCPREGAQSVAAVECGTIMCHRIDLFGSSICSARRLVVIDDADDFVGKYRDKLEDYFDKPKSSGVFVLQVESWPRQPDFIKKQIRPDCKSTVIRRRKNLASVQP